MLRVIKQHLQKQLIFFNYNSSISNIPLGCCEKALEYVNIMIAHTKSEQYKFPFSCDDILHSDKWALFIVVLSKIMWSPPPQLNVRENKDFRDIATKLYLLNKMLHGLDIHPSRKMPNIFYFRHPIGTIVGEFECQDFLVLYQQCTIGANIGVKAIGNPVLGRGVALLAGAKVLGSCIIGDNVIFGSNSMVINSNIPSNSVVVGQYPNHRVMKNRYNVIDLFFNLQKED